ncbi:uncharacterized protein METZ01_LOCUS270077 [marine metagenome]|uniref:CcmH/CycL/Ccl2/NrfF N-terminal domain-containing protein n=1 Tax=marine metagenome TaxID=408172 RepID=A0A382K125_9ZZZZ
MLSRGDASFLWWGSYSRAHPTGFKTAWAIEVDLPSLMPRTDPRPLFDQQPWEFINHFYPAADCHVQMPLYQYTQVDAHGVPETTTRPGNVSRAGAYIPYLLDVDLRTRATRRWPFPGQPPLHLQTNHAGDLWTRDCADPGFLWFEGAGMSAQLETSANSEHCPAIPGDHSHHWLPSGAWIGVFRLRGPYRGSTSGSSRHRVGPCSSSPRVFAGRPVDCLRFWGCTRHTDFSRRGNLASTIHGIVIPVITTMPKLILSVPIMLCMLTSALVSAQEATVDVEEEARALFTSIMSPYCPGSLLNECPSSQAAVLREDIRKRLSAGDTREQIEKDLIATYGEEILASPPFSGFGVLSWLGAVAIFLGGLGLASAWLRTRRGTGVTEQAASTASDAQLHERMRAEVAADDEI